MKDKKNYPITKEVLKRLPNSIKAKGFLKALVNHTYLERPKIEPKKPE